MTDIKQCDKCTKIFKSNSDLNRHIKTVHSNIKNYSCNTCDKRFKTKSYLTRHMLIHVASNDFKCDKCSKTFKTQRSLNRHQKCHMNIIYSCKECASTFTDNRNLSKHKNRFHSNVKSELPCEICGKIFYDKEYYSQHIKYRHNDTRSYSCDKCNKTFKRKGELLDHIEYIHNPKYIFSCQMCTKKFKQQKLLDQHIMRMHTKKRPEKCPDCELTFVTTSDVLRHAKVYHWTAEQRKTAKLNGWCTCCWMTMICKKTLHWELKMCDTCMIFKNLKRSQRYIQNYFLDLVKRQFQRYYPDIEYLPSTQDKQLIGGVSCNTSKRQPDLGFVIGKLKNGRMRFINCEIDEEAHSTRDEICELAKMDNTNQGVNNGDDEVIFIRIAVAYKDKKDVLETKAKLLVERIYYWMRNLKETTELYLNNYPAKVGVEYLYYSNTDGYKHVIASKANSNIEVLNLFD